MNTELQEKIDHLVSKASSSSLKKAQEILSSTYRAHDSSQSIFADVAQRLAYLAARFPATFAANSYVLQALLSRIPTFSCKTILDLGSGPATASLAASQIFGTIEKRILIEKSKEAIALGKELLTQESEWLCQDFQNVSEFPSADLVILSYSLGEVFPEINSVLLPLWKSDFKALIIIEPGTPSGYKTILKARETLLSLGAFLIAPCPHALKCPLNPPDWCHFKVRLSRTKLHRLLKGGSLGFEDEKFSYLIVTKKPLSAPAASRILRHPQKGKGHIHFRLCTPRGTEEDKVVSKKDGDLYRLAKDSEWGDLLE